MATALVAKISIAGGYSFPDIVCVVQLPDKTFQIDGIFIRFKNEKERKNTTNSLIHK